MCVEYWGLTEERWLDTYKDIYKIEKRYYTSKNIIKKIRWKKHYNGRLTVKE